MGRGCRTDWFLRHHAAAAPQRRWQEAALTWHALRGLPPEQLLDWITACGRRRRALLREPPADAEVEAEARAAALRADAAAAGSDGAARALLALAPAAEASRLSLYAAQGGHGELTLQLLALREPPAFDQLLEVSAAAYGGQPYLAAARRARPRAARASAGCCSRRRAPNTLAPRRCGARSSACWGP